jgi:hypothetical protein
MYIGDNSFIGTIAESFGHENLSEITGKLSGGELCFVLDAFDEAQMLSGWDQVQDFVEEAWAIVKGSSSPALVLLARTETAELLELALKIMAGSRDAFTMLEIDYFDRKAAEEFVGLQMQKMAREKGKPKIYQDGSCWREGEVGQEHCT